MKSALILICKIPKYLINFRKKYDYHTNIPGHITLCYLKEDTNYSEVINLLKKINKFNICLNNIVKKEDILYLSLKNVKKINNINKKIKKYIEKIPKSGYHLTLGLNKKKLKIPEEEINKIKIPITINIEKIWLMKKEDKEWYRSQTIFLKN